MNTENIVILKNMEGTIQTSKANKAKLNSIGDEYWWHVHNVAKRLQTKQNFSG